MTLRSGPGPSLPPSCTESDLSWQEEMLCLPGVLLQLCRVSSFLVEDNPASSAACFAREQLPLHQHPVLSHATFESHTRMSVQEPGCRGRGGLLAYGEGMLHPLLVLSKQLFHFFDSISITKIMVPTVLACLLFISCHF